MAVVSLADYLPRLGLAAAPEQAALAIDPVDRVAEAIESTRRALEAAHEERLASLRAEHEATTAARIEEARRAWVAGEAERLGGRIASAMEQLEASIAGAATRVLVPFLANAARRVAIDDLSSRLRALLKSGGTAVIRVAGPPDLLAALEERLGDDAAALEFAPDEAADVTVAADRTVIATQIGAWVDHLWKLEADAHG